MFSYANQTTFALHGSPGVREIADFNGDGALDLVISGAAYDRDHFNGDLVPYRFFSFGQNGVMVENAQMVSGGAIHAFEGFSADFNGDGRTDLLSINSGSDNKPWAGEHNVLMFGTDKGLVAADLSADRIDYHHSGDIGDIDNDGDFDVFSGSVWGQGFNAYMQREGAYFLINDGDGHFTAAGNGMSNLTRSLLSSKLVDVTGDGFLDLIAGWEPGGSLGTVFVNDRNGNFAKGADFGVGFFGSQNTTVNEIQPIDYDRDGDMDLLFAVTNKSYWGASIQLFRNDNGAFTEVSDALGFGSDSVVTQLGWINRLHIADMNSDGISDVVVSRTQDYGSILLGTTDGRFDYINGGQRGIIGVNWTPADIDGDGFLDLVTYSRDVSGNPIADITVRVYHNTTFDGLGTAAADNGAATAGADTLVGRDGDDYLWAGEGNDLIVGGANWDNTHGNQGDDTIYGGRGNDWVIGGKDQDLLFGEDGGDLVYGNIGNDTLYGQDGADRLLGGQGSDLLNGGAGDDFLSGDRGDDTVTGGVGADTFYAFAGSGLDRVTDFNPLHGDRVVLQPGQAYTVYLRGTDTVVDLGGADQIVLGDVALQTIGWIGLI